MVVFEDARRGREERGEKEAMEMAKRLMVLIGMLAVMLASAPMVDGSAIPRWRSTEAHRSEPR